MSTRSLTRSEMTALENQGCFSSDWSKVTVTEGFSTDHMHRVQFRGDVRIGSMVGGTVPDPGVGSLPGICDTTIENCQIGDRVRIHRVGVIRNYRVMDDAVIENVHEITVSGGSTFGNGVGVAVLNEAGGREIPIFDRLSAQMAYMMVCYRHDRKLQKVLEELIADYVRMVYSDHGTIGRGARIRNTGTLRDMRIGDSAEISGATLLENGTLMSNPIAPVEIGEAVSARDFIVQSGSAVHSGTILEKCFIGQGVRTGKQFSAENSLFFANCEVFHGEAVSVFAGPYTVTHHKSTLLIAGMFSFFNAGSGTNQSNHMYKLGPVHQGIVERGSKTGSFAYLLWPSRVGPFTVVMGKNMSGFDAGDFPFSYINGGGKRSFLTPGMNLVTVGARRDSEKWRKRDRRKDPEKFDLIRFDLLNPYIIGKMIRGLEILTGLFEQTAREQESVLYRGIRIKRLMLKSSRRYYELAISVFAGQQLMKRLEGIGLNDTIDSIRRRLSPESGSPAGKDGDGAGRNNPLTERWVDMAGMIAPAKAIEDLVREIGEGRYGDVDEVRSALQEIHCSYDLHAWEYTTGLLSTRFGIEAGTVGAGELIELISRWESDSIRLNRTILNDAAKEFDSASRIGYGIDGDADVAEADFHAVRGHPDENSFIRDLRHEIGDIEKKAAGLKALLGRL